jgi:hypothetical protein
MLENITLLYSQAVVGLCLALEQALCRERSKSQTVTA